MKTKFFNILRGIFFKNRFIETILVKLTNGRSIDNWIARLPANYYQYSAGTYRSAYRNGINYYLDISDYMEWVIYFGIIVEPRKALYELAEKANVIFDVGANVGETTLNMAKLNSTRSFIHSFEPEKSCYEKLSYNFGLNKFNNIKLNNIGLGEKAGTFYLAPPTSHNKGGNRILEKSDQKHNVTIVTMDEYIAQNKVERVDLIKIDIEGFELKALKGGVNCIVKFRPKLFIEVNDSNLKEQGNSAKELIAFLEPFYKTLKNAETNELVNSTQDLTNKHFDLIAFN